MAARFLIEEDEEQMRRELKEAFRFYDKEGKEKVFKLICYPGREKENRFVVRGRKRGNAA